MHGARFWSVLLAATLFPYGAPSPRATRPDEDLLLTLRRAADLIPGDAPTALRVAMLGDFQFPIAAAVEGGSDERFAGTYPVFQIRFARDWIIVDAALDRDLVSDNVTFSDRTYQTIQEAMRDARLVVVTHEHHDHVAGVVRSPYLAAIQRHTMLTGEQVHSLLTKPNDPRVKIDSATAARYVVLTYDPILPIAPGVVLIRASGHTPGSQMVYVRLASGREVILTGDVAWHSSGISTERQKPEASTRDFGGEDRAAITRQLHWLHSLPTSVTVVVSHDRARLAELVTRGELLEGLDLARR